MATASLIWGVPLSKLLIKEVNSSEITRYNEYTGVAYQKTITNIRWLLCGREIDPKGEDLSRYPYNIFPKELSVYAVEGCYTKIARLFIVGCPIACTDGEGDCHTEIEIDLIESIRKKTVELMEKLGYSGEIKLQMVHMEIY